jgi:chemotaxis signal transduction protein
VDRVTDFVEVDESAIEPVSRAVPGTEHMRGVAKLADGSLT